MKAPAAGAGGRQWRHDRFEFSRTILPELEKCQEDPKRLRNLFQTRRDRFKTIYGKFCLNNPKSEYIINNHEKYFTVSACETANCESEVLKLFNCEEEEEEGDSFMDPIGQ